MQIELVITEDAQVTGIYSDDLAGIIAQGEAVIERASHVEPAPGGGWEADMCPSGGPILRRADGSAFPTRAEALAAEVAWLRCHVFHLCE